MHVRRISGAPRTSGGLLSAHQNDLWSAMKTCNVLRVANRGRKYNSTAERHSIAFHEHPERERQHSLTGRHSLATVCMSQTKTHVPLRKREPRQSQNFNALRSQGSVSWGFDAGDRQLCETTAAQTLFNKSSAQRRCKAVERS